jgi:HAD superfamily hydrolase (TIGR01509 family)
MADFAVIFDMDGVMVHSNPHHKIAIQKFCLAHGIELNELTFLNKIYGRTNRDWIKNVFGDLTDEQANAYAMEKEAHFREIYEPYITPVHGLVAFLDLLVANNIPRAIATSAPPENVDFVLDKTRLRKYFEIILDERVVTHGKPNPEIYLKTAKALGFPNDKCIVIEDSLSGVTAARRSGSKVIGITTTHTPEELKETNLVIQDFTELTIAKLKALLM